MGFHNVSTSNVSSPQGTNLLPTAQSKFMAAATYPSSQHGNGGLVETEVEETKVRWFTVPCCSIIPVSERCKKNLLSTYS